MMTPDDPRHGTRNGYRAGCRETCCVEGNRAYHAAYYAEYRQYLGHEPMVDAGPTLLHLDYLMRHATIPEIAHAAGVTDKAVRWLTETPPSQVREHIQDRVLGLTPDRIVTRLGLVRRVRALVAIGWSVERLARAAGVTKATARTLRNGEPLYMTTGVRDRVLAAYERLSATLPTAANASEKGAVTRARNLAARNRWAPPLAWDNIDDPYEAPDVARETSTTRRADLDEFTHLIRGGESIARAATRLGVTISAIEQAARRTGRTDLVELVAAERHHQRRAAA